MELQPDEVNELLDALERRVEFQADAARRAIREYKESILHETVSGRVRHLERQRDVEYAVNRYRQLRRELDELRAQMSPR